MKLRSRDLGAWILPLALACLILSPLTPCYSMPRHVDPSQVSEELPLPTGLLKLYGEVVGALVKGNFTKADLNLRKLVEVYAPPNLRYVYDRFNELLRREEALLNLTASKLREASELLEGGELAEAKGSLREALGKLAVANLTYFELRDVAEEFHSRSRIPLPRLLGEVKAALERYYSEAGRLTRLIKLAEAKALRRTYLGLTLSPEEAWVGAPLRLSGYLEDEEGRPLAGRLIIVRIGDLSFNVSTGPKGYFSLRIKAPYVYRRELRVWGEYLPLGRDEYRYAPCRSNELTLRLKYEVPELTVRLEGRGEPGGSVRLRGNVTPGLNLTVTAFNETYYLPSLKGRGFDLPIRIPASLGGGTYPVTVKAGPKGVYCQVVKVIGLKVRRLPLSVEVEAPSVIVVGQSLRVSGRVSGPAGPLKGVKAYLTLGGRIYEGVSDEGGRFELRLPTSPLMGTGSYSYSVSFVPQDPRYEASSLTGDVYLVNPFAYLPLAAFAYFLYRGARPKLSLPRIPLRPARRREEVSRAEAVRLKGMLKIYMEAVDYVTSLTGLRLGGSDTVREYLAKVRPLLNAKEAKALEGLTLMFEEYVYGGREVDLSLAGRLLAELRGGRSGVG